MKMLKHIAVIIVVLSGASLSIPAHAQSAQREMMKTQDFIRKNPVNQLDMSALAKSPDINVSRN